MATELFDTQAVALMQAAWQLTMRRERDLRWCGPRERFATRLYWETQLQRLEQLQAAVEVRLYVRQSRERARSRLHAPHSATGKPAH